LENAHYEELMLELSIKKKENFKDNLSALGQRETARKGTQ